MNLADNCFEPCLVVAAAFVLLAATRDSLPAQVPAQSSGTLIVELREPRKAGTAALGLQPEELRLRKVSPSLEQTDSGVLRDLALRAGLYLWRADDGVVRGAKLEAIATAAPVEDRPGVLQFAHVSGRRYVGQPITGIRGEESGGQVTIGASTMARFQWTNSEFSPREWEAVPTSGASFELSLHSRTGELPVGLMVITPRVLLEPPKNRANLPMLEAHLLRLDMPGAWMANAGLENLVEATFHSNSDALMASVTLDGHPTLTDGILFSETDYGPASLWLEAREGPVVVILPLQNVKRLARREPPHARPVGGESYTWDIAMRSGNGTQRFRLSALAPFYRGSDCLVRWVVARKRIAVLVKDNCVASVSLTDVRRLSMTDGLTTLTLRDGSALSGFLQCDLSGLVGTNQVRLSQGALITAIAPSSTLDTTKLDDTNGVAATVFGNEQDRHDLTQFRVLGVPSPWAVDTDVIPYSYLSVVNEGVLDQIQLSSVKTLSWRVDAETRERTACLLDLQQDLRLSGAARISPSLARPDRDPTHAPALYFSGWDRLVQYTIAAKAIERIAFQSATQPRASGPELEVELLGAGKISRRLVNPYPALFGRRPEVFLESLTEVDNDRHVLIEQSPLVLAIPLRRLASLKRQDDGSVIAHLHNQATNTASLRGLLLSGFKAATDYGAVGIAADRIETFKAINTSDLTPPPIPFLPPPSGVRFRLTLTDRQNVELNDVFLSDEYADHETRRVTLRKNLVISDRNFTYEQPLSECGRVRIGPTAGEAGLVMIHITPRNQPASDRSGPMVLYRRTEGGRWLSGDPDAADLMCGWGGDRIFRCLPIRRIREIELITVIPTPETTPEQDKKGNKP